MLITPISPKVIASPRASSTKIEPADRPKKALLTQLVSVTCRSICAADAVAASASAGSVASPLARFASRSRARTLLTSPSARAAATRSAGSASAASSTIIAALPVA